MLRFPAIAILAVLSLSACAEGPEDTRSLRATFADWIAPPGHAVTQGVPPSPPAVDPTIQQAYTADAARMNAGLPAMAVSQVTIVGGEIDVPVGGVFSGNAEWRPHAGAATVTVAECQSVPLTLQRGDKYGVGATLYVTRVAGLVYVAPWGGSTCRAPASAQAFAGQGGIPLIVRDKVRNATIITNNWGSQPPYPYPPAVGP